MRRGGPWHDPGVLPAEGERPVRAVALAGGARSCDTVRAGVGSRALGGPVDEDAGGLRAWGGVLYPALAAGCVGVAAWLTLGTPEVDPDLGPITFGIVGVAAVYILLAEAITGARRRGHPRLVASLAVLAALLAGVAALALLLLGGVTALLVALAVLFSPQGRSPAPLVASVVLLFGGVVPFLGYGMWAVRRVNWRAAQRHALDADTTALHHD